MNYGKPSPGKRHNDSYGSQRESGVLPMSSLLRKIAQNVKHEPVVKKEKYKKVGRKGILSDAQVIQLRTEYGRGIRISKLVALHNNWPLPSTKKGAESTVRNIVLWINRRWRLDGGQFDGGPAPKGRTNCYGRGLGHYR